MGRARAGRGNARLVVSWSSLTSRGGDTQPSRAGSRLALPLGESCQERFGSAFDTAVACALSPRSTSWQFGLPTRPDACFTRKDSWYLKTGLGPEASPGQEKLRHLTLVLQLDEMGRGASLGKHAAQTARWSRQIIQII